MTPLSRLAPVVGRNRSFVPAAAAAAAAAPPAARSAAALLRRLPAAERRPPRSRRRALVCAAQRRTPSIASVAAGTDGKGDEDADRLLKQVAEEHWTENSRVDKTGARKMQAEMLKEFATLRDRGYRVGPACYLRMLTNFAHLRSEERVVQLFNQMLEDNIEPSLYHWTQLMVVHAKHGKTEKVDEVRRRMREAGVQLNTNSMNVVIQGLVRSGDASSAMDVLEQMEQDRDPAPDNVTYNTVINSCNTYEEVFDILERMRRSGVSADNYTINSVLNMMRQNRDTDSMEALIGRMRELAERWPDVSPDSRSYNTLISAYRAKKDLGGVVDVLARMQEDRVEPDTVTYLSLLSAIQVKLPEGGKDGEYHQLAERAFAQADARGLLTSQEIWERMRQIHTKAGDKKKADGIKHRMKATQGIKVKASRAAGAASSNPAA
eukprot:TRINITY_DN3742_c0_g1_i1.p1 TRINITY_DN3742_c0_g1~~TRINITY_DN3742_c0_g1_i1.p1  ORF type:complete len:435 (+),score=110.38 TRINITY_DN3742_c0_g1_i1:114-1418(+)